VRAARHVRKVPDAQMLATVRSPIDRACARNGRGPLTNNYVSDSIFIKTSPAMISGSPRMRSCMLA
jgi:hypothetical protein